MFWFLIGTIVILIVLIIVNRLLEDEGFEKIPGPKGILLAENALDFLMDPVKLFYRFRTLASRYKYLFRLKFAMKKVIVLYNPEDVEIILSGTKNTKKGFLYAFIEPWLQEGLLLSDGPKWLHRRKILTPTFHFNILRHFHSILEEKTRILVKELETEAKKPKTGIWSYVSDFTLNSICETAMGIKLEDESTNFVNRYKTSVYELGQLLVYRAQRVWAYPDLIWRWTRAGKKQERVLNLLGSFRDRVIKNRTENYNFENIEKMILDAETADESNEDAITMVYGKKRLAMLDLLLQAKKQGTIDAKGIGEEVDTFMFEGHDTTATALQFCFMALANCFVAQEKAREEVDNIFLNSDRSATMKDLNQMKYVECCIKEALRLYPPVHFFMRQISQNTQLKNYTVPAGTECAILTYDLHRRADQFVEPLEYKPERFLGEPTWHPYSYVPFSAGPRNCIGQKFAMMEMKLAVSSVLRYFKMLPVTKSQDVILITDFILRAKTQVFIKFEKRS